MTKTPEGFKRIDGKLVWNPGLADHRISYQDPGEALYRWWGGELVPTCSGRTSGMWSSGPCDHKPRHDPDANGLPTKCGNHSKAGIERREAKKAAELGRWHQQWDARAELNSATAAVEAALRKIAAGDNDPRTLALETIQRLDTARAANKAVHEKAKP